MTLTGSQLRVSARCVRETRVGRLFRNGVHFHDNINATQLRCMKTQYSGQLSVSVPLRGTMRLVSIFSLNNDDRRAESSRGRAQVNSSRL